MWWQSNTTIKISIHALLAESDHFATLKFVNPYISIHALLAESDNIPLPNAHVISISIHALLAESDIDLRNIIRTRLVFLSTLSLRRATQVHRYRLKNHHYFYPRSPCGERLTVFSIFQVVIIFLSTLSLRRATVYLASQTFDIDISIHALLAESDQPHFPCTELYQHFYPRSPCGERLFQNHIIFHYNLFLSTLSLRRATRSHRSDDRSPIHFYPRSPCGERQLLRMCHRVDRVFLSTLSLRRATSRPRRLKSRR